MRALSLWQPWASAWVMGIKRIETRHWSTDYRGPLVVHAAKRWGPDERDDWIRLRKVDLRWPVEPPLGAIVGLVDLVNVVRTETLIDQLTDNEARWGNYGPGRYGFIAENFRPLATPIPWRGHQSFFDIPTETIRRAGLL